MQAVSFAILTACLQWAQILIAVIVFVSCTAGNLNAAANTASGPYESRVIEGVA